MRSKTSTKGRTSEIIELPDEQLIELPDDFDIVRLMDSAIDPLTNTVRDLKVDDRDLPLATNYHDFAYRIIGKDANPPWARQMWIGLFLFGEVCTACTNQKWMDIHNIHKKEDSQFMVDKLKLLKNGVCPICKRAKWDLIKNHGLNDYQQLVNVLGQRSGKSSSCASYNAYVAHQYLKFPNLGSLARMEMQASTQLTGTMVSLTMGKAVGLMWTPFRKIIDGSSWFNEYHKMLKYYGAKYSKELFRNTSQLYLDYYHKNLRFYPSGPKASVLRGDTRLFGVLDELGLFPLGSTTESDDDDSTNERANADEAHKSLSRSLTTVQNIRRRLLAEGISAVPPAILFNISSPKSKRDKMMRLLRQSRSEEGRKYMLGVNLPTWEMHPTMERDDPVIVLAYMDDPETAERDYGANPPSVHSQFVPANALNVFTNGQNSHRFMYMLDRPGEIYGKVERVRNYKWPSIVAIDAGHVNNSFSIVGAHYDFDKQKTVVTSIIECMALEGRRVNFNELYLNVILPLCKDLNAVGLFADQWQGLDILYRIDTDMGNNPLGKTRCRGRQFTPRRRHFDQVVSMMQSANILLPTVSEKEFQRIVAGDITDYRVDMKEKPVDHLLLQCHTVRDMGEARCPGKGEGYTDDIFRAYVLAAAFIHEPKVMERLKEAKDFNYGDKQSAACAPVFVGRSGGWGRFRR